MDLRRHLRRPARRADAGGLRLRLACAGLVPDRLEPGPRREPYTYDTSPLAQDWKIHIEDVEARTVPLPAELADLLQRLDQHLDRLADDAPLAALKAVRALETIIATTGPAAAFMAVSGAEIPWSRIAEGLGTTESEARSRLRRYEYPRRP
ncbi:hypothetical protein [Streptomyces purpureus]|uniref:hypothetical protein n=1 Tax=Streptomyces purpureus TaxID=1951 RepID=UPI0003A13A81|nr:hypothetical protein [Streptomyces purpureus]